MSRTEHILKMAAMIIGAAVVFGVATMLLWNVLMPGIFGLPAIGFFHAVGLLILGRLLFGSLGGHFMRHGQHHHNMIHEKWKNMSPEDRQAFMNSHHHHHFFGGRCRSKGEHRPDGDGAGAPGENKE